MQGYLGHANITTTQRYMHHIPKTSDAGDLKRLVESESPAVLPVSAVNDLR